MYPTGTSKLSEEDIKFKYITPAIEKAGWSKDQISLEKAFTDGRVNVINNYVSRGQKKRADYILSYKNNLPLAVVEAKRDTHSIGSGIQQAISYAEILDIRFAYSSNGKGFLEHDMKTGKETELSIDEFPSPEMLWSRYKHENNIDQDQEKILTEPYYFSQNYTKTPRYYQRIAINKTVEAIAKGQKRILLVMATGTGKTYTAFQIVHRLRKAGVVKKILYLADRNILIDQTLDNDFKPFEKVMTKIKNKTPDSSYEVYMSLYHQLAGDENDEPFRKFSPDFFDLIIVDECHRGSAKDDSLWRRILEYFSSAVQIGMTATPKETKEISNLSYFGEPLYTYSLKQGINDGFLAPYKVERIHLDRDLEGWRPEAGKLDKNGYLIDDRIYTGSDFDKSLVLSKRTELVAHIISEFLKNTNRFDKTIVFCVDIDHAERMRQALINENSDLVAENPKYIMKITGDNDEGKKSLSYFTDETSKYPVIATTSELMTTGVDCKTCKLIVLDKIINSVIEFKQIIGRGTRLKPEYGKEFFTIMDFREASRLFSDPDWDGDPISIKEVGPHEHNTKSPVIHDKPEKYIVDDVKVKILSQTVQYYDENGKLITESVTDYSKRNILGQYATLDAFLNDWNSDRKKQTIIDELQERGVLLDALREEVGKDIDDFDLICHLAFDKKPLTRSERMKNVKKSDYLSKYEGLAREVLDAILEKYMDNGIYDLENTNILANEPFRSIGSPKKIVDLFGGKMNYLSAIRDLEAQIYT